MKWKHRKIESGYEYEIEKPKPLDFWETYILFSSIFIVLILAIAVITG